MTDLGERATSRKFLLVLVSLIAGTGLAVTDMLTDAWVNLVTLLNGLYLAGNITQKKLVPPDHPDP